MVLIMFVPYFLIAAAGIELPFVGMASLDTSFELTNAMTFMILFANVGLGTSAYLEFTEIMPDDVFFYYHIPLCAAIAYWFFMASTGIITYIFFSAPFMFLIWGYFAAFSKTTLPAMMV